MEAALKALVVLVIGAVLLVAVGSILLIIKGSLDESSDLACASSVLAKRFVTASNGDTPVQLKGCETRYREIGADDSEAEARDRIVSDTLWCFGSFGGNTDTTLVTGEETLCHVCALYTTEEAREVGGVFEELQRRWLVDLGETGRAGDEDITLSIGERLQDWEGLEEASIAIDAPVAVLFIQSREFDSWLTSQIDRYTGAGEIIAGTSAVSGTVMGARWGARAGAFGIVVGGVGGAAIVQAIDGDMSQVSGIIISRYDEAAIREMGCTLSTPEP